MTRAEIMVVFGTRPEVIKLGPVVEKLRQRPDLFSVRTVATGQHREMLEQALDFFCLQPDVSLDIMRENQDLFDVTERAMEELRSLLAARRPAALLVQGDTTTAFCAALAGYYCRIPVGHVEAGLRSGDRFNPYPEEVNRRLVGSIAEWHFAPTAAAAAHLVAEGVSRERVFITGNTVIDALQSVLARRAELPAEVAGVRPQEFARRGRRLLLVTCHRRESFGPELDGICAALRQIADERPDVVIVYPVHPNPNVSAVAHARLGGHDRIRLLPPLDYFSFLALMTHAELILTDSGGVQEEAPALGKPVLVLRKTTERPEGIEAGVARLAGTERAAIVRETLRLLDDPDAKARMARAVNPYGDGHASERIVDVLAAALAQIDAALSDVEGTRGRR